MAKATAKATLSIKNYKKAGKDLNTILAADDDGNPAIPVKGTEEEIKAKLIEAIQFITKDDELKKSTRNVLDALAKEAEEAPAKEEPAKEETTGIPARSVIDKMNKGALEQLCDDQELETDPDDYEKVKDLKAAMIAEMFNDNAPEDASSEAGKADPEPEKEKETLPASKKSTGKKSDTKTKGMREGSARQIIADLVNEKKHTKEQIIVQAEKQGVVKKHVVMYLRAWTKGDRVPYYFDGIAESKKQVLSFA